MFKDTFKGRTLNVLGFFKFSVIFCHHWTETARDGQVCVFTQQSGSLQFSLLHTFRQKYRTNRTKAFHPVFTTEQRPQ